MALFQAQVERQFISVITTDLNPIYNQYLAYFGNEQRQANIRQVSEEQYQGEFIRALFVDILGYTAQPEPSYNLLREKKNETDSKSADAAIIINQQVIGVVELKDHKTQDLKKVEIQAFGYKNNHRNCHYVVTSNFERLRFYIDNAVEFIEFDLFHLSFDDFRRLWLCLSYESIAKNLPQEIKKQSISNEDIITKKLYKDYSVFKRQLFDNIVALNPTYDKLLLFKKTQKLLDRYLFLFFAEDKGLLPANSIQGTVEKWMKYNADPMNDYQSLYSRFVKYFHLLNVGYKDTHIEIYAYNGGLFADDDVLNDIKIDDKILSENVLILARYDYDTDVDVNILGHIFENSLNEIEEVANEITTGVKLASKRKQDGVFYTPRYITQYIVENTVGRLCEEKKAALGIGEELFEYKRKDKKKEALKIFDVYREWLLQITILDPACGSGAFLNMALEFLIAEHKWIDDQQEKIAGLKNHYSMELSNIENSILENNLFGVDINEESVEIAKLSLWLRTAKPHRKLTSLNNNIKCGNSLIDDPAIAGAKAFNWEKEFPQVFGRKASEDQTVVFKKDETPDYLKLIKEKTAEAQQKAEQGIALSKEALEISKQLAEYAEKLESLTASEANAIYGGEKRGFDAVIGNPPYGAKIDDEQIKYATNTYKNWGISASLNDTYFIFYAMSLQKLLKTNGYLGFITPNTWKLIESAKLFRNNLLNSNYKVVQIIQHINKVFADATVDCDTLIVSKNDKKGNILIRFIDGAMIKTERSIKQETIAQQDYINLFLSQKDYCLKEKIISKSVFVKDTFVVKNGVKPYEKGKGKPAQTEFTMKEKPFTSEMKIDDSFSPLIGGSYFNRYQILWDNNYWIQYGEWLAAPREKEIFDAEEKLIFRQTSDSIIGSYITKGFVMRDNTHILLNKIDSPYNLKYTLAILNSKLVNWFYWTINPERGEAMAQVKAFHLGLLPLYSLNNEDQQPFVVKVDQITALNTEFLYHLTKLQRMLQRKLELQDLPGKLQNWYTLSYGEFVKELSKKKVKLTLAQEDEWEEYFTAEQAKTLEIKKQIDTTDREIDRMVYELYGLTEEEIKIVEGEG